MVTSRYIHIYAEDMNEEKRNRAIEVSQEAFHMPSIDGKMFSNVAKVIRDDFNKLYGIGWNCVVGKAFGSYVTHEMKTYL